ncbi:MAG: hypothetical protein ABI354_00700 [Candidatus Saccharimonadales bacterium]
MKNSTMKSQSNFFKNKDGKLAVWQLPNIPISVWIVSLVLSHALNGSLHTGFQALAQASLFVWAYLEATSGDSNFRKVLGVVILAVVISGFFNV